MIKVNIAWSRPAAEIAETKGFGALEKSKKQDLTFETKEFASKEIALAYLEGVADANGWDDPWTEINGEEAPISYIVASTHGEQLDDDCEDRYSVFRGEDGNAYDEALEEYNGRLKIDDAQVVVLARIIESTDY